MPEPQKSSTNPTLPATQERFPTPSPETRYLQFRGASCCRTLSPLANLILLLALLPSTIVGTLSHWKPPLRVRSHLGVIVLRQLSCRTSSPRKWDWGHHIGEASPRDIHGMSVARKHKRPSNPHNPIRVLLLLPWKNAPSRQAIMKIWVHRDPVPVKSSSSWGAEGWLFEETIWWALQSCTVLTARKCNLPFFFFFFFFTSPCLKSKNGNSHCNTAWQVSWKLALEEAKPFPSLSKPVYCYLKLLPVKQ